MPGFTYTPFVPPDVPSIAALIAHSADPYATAATNIAAINARAMESTAAARAHAAEVSGDIWGRTIQGLGQMPLQMMAEERANADAAQLRSLRQSEIDQNNLRTQQEQRAMVGQQRLTQLVSQHTDPQSGEIDHEAVARAASSDPFIGPDRAATYLDTQVKAKENFAKLTDLNTQRATAVSVAVGRAAQASDSPETFAAQLDHAVLMKALTPQEAQTYAGQAQQQPWDAFKTQAVSTADRLTAKPLKADESIVGGLTGSVLASGPKKLENEAELAADAATVGTPQETLTANNSAKALESLRAQKNPPGLEEQYLQARTAGDSAKAQSILQTLRETANAKKDPAAAALADQLKQLNVKEAQARLDALKEKNAPIDISGSVNTTMSGRTYVDLSEWQTPEDRAKAQKAAVAQGVIPVNKDVAGMLNDLDTARQNQQTMLSLIESKLPKDASGRLLKGPANAIEKLMQTDPDLASIGTFRNAAIQSMRAVAGSKGLRINQAEVQLAIDNDIPKLSDTLDAARQKLRNLSAFMENVEKSHLIRDRSGLTGTSATPAPTAITLTPGLQGLANRPGGGD